MASVKPRLVLGRTTPSLFQSLNVTAENLEPLSLHEHAEPKAAMYLSIFSTLPHDFPLKIPETLIKSNGSEEPIFVSIAPTGKVICTKAHAVDSFFRSAFSVHMFRSLSRPSPFLLPKFVVRCAAGLLFCSDQAETLRQISTAEWYMVQTFVAPKDQKAQKFRVVWRAGEHHVVTVIEKIRQFPYNTPAMRTTHGGAHSRARKHPTVPSRTTTANSNLSRKHRLSEADQRGEGRGPLSNSPYSVSFTAPGDSVLTEVYRQEVDDNVALMLRFLREWVAHRDEVLQAAEFDLIQGTTHWYFLNLKSVTTAKRTEIHRHRASRPRLLRAISHSRYRSFLDESLEEAKSYLDDPQKPFVTRSKYIDLGDVQDRNIQIYKLLKDSLAV